MWVGRGRRGKEVEAVDKRKGNKRAGSGVGRKRKGGKRNRRVPIAEACQDGRKPSRMQTAVFVEVVETRGLHGNGDGGT